MENIVEKLIDGIFELSKEKIALLTILLLALVLRIMAAINLGVNADDMHFVTDAIGFLSSEKLVTWSMSAGLWHAVTDIFYNLIGFTQLASRSTAVIFGALTVFIVYLLSKEFFNKKVSIISAFLVAIATFHIKNTTASQDVMAMFFSLCAIVLFIQALKNQKSYFYMISGIFIGLAIYTKVYPLLFIPSMLLYALYYHKKLNKSLFSKSNIKRISLFIIVAFIFTIPALTHNYLLYKDKGFLDLQFTRTLGLGKTISAQYYSWDHQFEAKNDWKGLILGNSTNSASKKPTLLSAIDFIRLSDPITFYLGIIGIIIVLFFRKNYRSYAVFFLFNILLILPFLASLILLPKHFIFLELLIIPLGALAAGELDIKISKIMKKTRIKAILFILLLISLILLGLPNVPKIFSPNTYNTYGKSHMAQIIEFKDKNIPENALVIGDSRIYRGQINWAFQGRP